MKMNKPVRVSVNGRHQGYIDLHRTFWGRVWFKMVLWTKRILKLSAFTAFIYGVFLLGGWMNPAIKVQKVDAVREVEVQAPIMDRIAGCESQGNVKAKGTQFDSNGQVLMRSNSNKTVDVGKYQINTVYFAKASQLGYDLTTEQGNEGMAMWIYKNKGTGDWSSSAYCWK